MCETLGTNWEGTAKEQIFLRLEADKAIQRVRELHKEISGRSYSETTCSECYGQYTYYEYQYPCPTIKALDGEQ